MDSTHEIDNQISHHGSIFETKPKTKFISSLVPSIITITILVVVISKYELKTIKSFPQLKMYDKLHTL